MTFDRHSTADEVLQGRDLTGRDVIVTGGAAGLGAETARALAAAGARVLLAGRDDERGRAAADRIRDRTGNPHVEFRTLRLDDLASVRAFAADRLATGRPLHLLINNAGVMANPLTRTADGFESQFGVNHLGHFALTTALLPALLDAGTARVVALSSRGHRRGEVDFDDPNYERRPYDAWQAYGQSKTANGLFAVGLTARHGAEGVTANAVMPGSVMTDLMRHMTPADFADRGWADEDGRPRTDMPGWKTVAQGAATSVWAAVAPELDRRGGLYLDNCAVGRPWTVDGVPPDGYYLPYLLDADRAEQLWELSLKLTA
ncbi:MAG TPA: SDR family NAD(P)-dependent oxidoreductase [Actinocrinis sp.]|nr:SDR family NAD(P)-dependent oxidoreductase [Actinocrinis sp.]